MNNSFLKKSNANNFEACGNMSNFINNEENNIKMKILYLSTGNDGVQ